MMNNESVKEIKTGLVIMASGLSKRYGANKLMALLDEKPLIKWIIDVTENLFERRVVVTRNTDVKRLCENLNLDCIYHEFPGRNDTVRLGLNALMTDIDYCFFMPGDQPLIRIETIKGMLDIVKSNDIKIIRASFSDNAGSPVGFYKSFFEELLNLPEGKGGNTIVMKNISDTYLYEVKDEWELWDVDTVEDLEKINILLKNTIQ